MGDTLKKSVALYIFLQKLPAVSRCDSCYTVLYLLQNDQIMIQITASITIDDAELDWQAIRASGPGGQHVNKTSTAMQLMFDINQSSLPDHYKTTLLQKSDHRITASGKIVIKSQQSRSQEMNRETALQQLIELIKSAGIIPKKRHATKPTYGSQQRRLDSKKQRSGTKSLRQQKPGHD